MSNVLVEMTEDEYDFIVKFDADRERTANRRDLVSVIQHIQSVIEDGRLPE